MSFQSSVNIYNTVGFPGDLAFDGPIRAQSYNLNSSSPSTPLNVVGNIFTVTDGGNPNTSSGSPLAGTATVGGTGTFAGMLVNKNEYAYSSTAVTGPLTATLALPDNAIGDLAIMGEFWASFDNIPSVGDLAIYNTTDGSLSSIPPIVNFTASIAPGGASTPDVMTVTVVAQGKLEVGQLVSGAGIPGGTYILSLGTGKGYTGTYNLSTINTLTVSSEAMTSPSVPAAAFSGTASSSGTTLTIATVVSGQVYIGMPVVGTGFAAGTVITAFGTGVGGTGTYTINQSNTVSPAVAITASTHKLVPNGVVSHFDSSFPGLAVLKLTN